MPDSQSVTQEGFRMLLGWLDADVELAGLKYERIRGRLIHTFVRRGCYEAELLADRTIDRVISKLSQIQGDYSGDPARYFYGVANHVYQEWNRSQRKERELTIIDLTVRQPGDDDRLECLLNCLAKLSSDSRDLIIEYHLRDGREKIEHRKGLASRLGLSTGALQSKTSRIRSQLENCVGECINKKLS